MVDTLRILGSYPAARAADEPPGGG
jgi:hypothetical protein